MARVTVEDCVDKVDITVPRDNDKNPFVALREIADETLIPEDLKEDLIHSLQKHVEVDELEETDLPEIAVDPLAAEAVPGVADADAPDAPAFGSMSEDDLLRGIEGLVAPERSDDY